MTLSLVLAGLLLGGGLPGTGRTLQEGKEEKLILPGEAGYVLKRARELVELSKTRDAGDRTDLLVSQSRERLREREALGNGPFAPETARVARGLGDSYRRLVLEGGAGAIECGVAEGRDMKPVQKRYLEAVEVDHPRWNRVVSSLPAEERAAQEHVLGVPAEAPRRSQEAEAAGLDFLKKERARRDGVPLPAADRPEGPKPPASAPPEPAKPAADVPAPKPGPEGHKPEPERPKPDDGVEAPRHPEHHAHPHRPHH